MSSENGRMDWRRFWGSVWEAAILLMAVVLPAIAVAVEAATGFSAGLFFDPVPTPMHLVLVAMVPAVNLLAWLGLRRGWMQSRPFIGFMNGAGLAVSAFYTIPYLPLVPFALAAVFSLWWYLGVGLVGLLPLAPMAALIAGVILRRRLIRAFYTLENPGRPAFGLGFAATLVILLLAFSGEFITLAGLRLAISGTPDQQKRGLAMLRQTRQHDIILRMAHGYETLYDQTVIRWVAGGKMPDREQARRLYYQVTGQDALHVRPHGNGGPGLFSRGRSIDEGFEWDEDQAGLLVGGILSGLFLEDSRLDGTLDGDAGVGYLEWTLVFKNEGHVRREARAKVAIPPGAVVSRLTLWVNGEEREAAFGPRGKVREAYDKVVKARRDPVLVTTCGPDRIMVQCFPVEPNGGEMKMRIGLTVPLQPDRDIAGQWKLRMPLFLERNFKHRSGAHEVWIASKAALEPVPGLAGLACAMNTNGEWSARGRIQEGDLWKSDASLSVSGEGDGSAWCPDDRHEAPGLVKQTLARLVSDKPESVMLVLDGSASMKDAAPRVIQAVSNDFPEGVWLGVMLADDKEPLAPQLRVMKKERMPEVTEPMSAYVYVGGQCGVRFIEKAWDALASEAGPAAIVWVHGAQPLTLDTVAGLIQRMQRQPGMAHLYTLQVGPGADKMSDELDQQDWVTVLPPCLDPAAPLGELFKNWAPVAAPLRAVRVREEKADASGLGGETSDHLARLWAKQEISLLLATGLPKNRQAASELGVRYRLVTPVSGAVVLETDDQYQAAGLEQPPAENLPTVPEPEFWILVIISLGFVAVMWFGRKTATA